MNHDDRLDLSSMSSELTFLLDILSDGNLKTKKRDLTGLDWDLFLKLAMHHRVYPLLYAKVKNLDGIPLEVLQTLKNKTKENTLQMLKLSAEIGQIGKVFENNQIPLLFIKGPVLAAELYGDISLRTSKDLDLLISSADMEKAEKLLQKLGYVKETFPSILNEWKWRRQHIVFIHPQKHVIVEVHWKLEFPSGQVPSFQQLWERKRVSLVSNIPVYYLGEADLFIYLITHGTRHGWFRLRWLLDVHQMIKRGLNIEEVSKYLKKYRGFRIGGLTLILLSELLSTSIKDSWNFLLKRRDSHILAQLVIHFINRIGSLEEIYSMDEFYKFIKFSKLLNGSRILKKAINCIYPSYKDAQTLRLPKSLYSLYFPLRPILVLTRKVRRDS
ncbi:nucleotidyltransferase family protein [Bacillus sp. BRMEA1]|uniref:nucleotidyltransferase domain-containing protein n=1 Tax=Neobacillus endophyticus TaxID=2738405 RepID=UPI001566D392|nr:nucleotidyltransferase family protein [Neobacillus endophyticus]NRD76977.1 nucleotidyltransferase family protein [Neobacillus endophyticus]